MGAHIMDSDVVTAGSKTVLAEPRVRNELRSVAAMLCTRFPERTPQEIELLVSGTYERLAENARIRAHLIPLTLNRCRRRLTDPAPIGSAPHTQVSPVHVANVTCTGDAA